MRHTMAVKLEIGPPGRPNEVEATVYYLCDVDSEPEDPRIHILEVNVPGPNGVVSAPWLENFIMDEATTAELLANARRRKLAA